MSVKSFSDFKGLKEGNIAELESIGIKNVDELVAALDDEAKVKEIIKTLSGVGPKTVMKWKEIASGKAAPAKKKEEKPKEEKKEEPKKAKKEKKSEKAEEGEKPKKAKKEKKSEQAEKKDGAEKEEKKEKADVEVVEEPKAYVPNKKAEISSETASELAKRAIISGRRPAFKRQEWYRYSKLGEGWRRPKGIHSKMRRHFKRRPHVVDIGFRGPNSVRGLHPSGFEEVLVHNIDGLENIDPKKQAIRIGSTVGTRKRITIQDKADELGIRILNRMV